MRLAEKEESMLEKDLIFEQVCRLADRVHKKADTGKEDTLYLAKNVSRRVTITRKVLSRQPDLCCAGEMWSPW